MSITNTNLWGQLQPYFFAEVDSQTTSRNPRIRVEVKPMPPQLEAEAIALKMPCVACGAPIYPVRSRLKGGRIQTGRMYYAPCCPLDVKIGCSRGKAAREEYKLMRRALP